MNTANVLKVVAAISAAAIVFCTIASYTAGIMAGDDVSFIVSLMTWIFIVGSVNIITIIGMFITYIVVTLVVFPFYYAYKKIRKNTK